jgi:hypothetical protein
LRNEAAEPSVRALRLLVVDDEPDVRATLAQMLSEAGHRSIRQAEAGEQAAEVLAFLQRDAAAVDLGDVADDGEAEAGAGLAGGVEPLAAGEQFGALSAGMPGPSSSTRMSTKGADDGSTVTNTRPEPYLAAFSTRLPSISSRSWRSTRTSAFPCRRRCRR